MERQDPVIYFFPGMGADERLFKYASSAGYHRIMVKYPLPEENESLADFCLRLLSVVDDSRPSILVGVSFGGIVAAELSKLLKHCIGIIIISSVRSPAEFPRWMRIAEKLKLRKVANPSLIRNVLVLVRLFIGSGSKESFRIFREMLFDTPDKLFKWELRTAMAWKGCEVGKTCYRIHGTKDHLFPLSRIRNAIPVDGGKHFMIFNLADKVNPVLEDCIKKLSGL